MMMARRFLRPWSLEEQSACFVVRDHNRQALAYVYFEDEADRRSAAKSMALKKKAALGGLKVSFSSDTSDGDGSGEDSRHSSGDGSSDDDSHSGDDGSRSSHKDSGSTALVDILQWADHFEPWLSWPRPPARPPPERCALILS
jgi:hypothetical protein